LEEDGDEHVEEGLHEDDRTERRHDGCLCSVWRWWMVGGGGGGRLVGWGVKLV
jgi:hypothetical protein